jgi:cytochrome c biogenesis protein CcmG/thiol:disulfide interchange protein DsbE
MGKPLRHFEATGLFLSARRNWKLRALLCAGMLSAAGLLRGGDVKLAVLRVGGEVYSNVTVTTVTATDIYFTHSGGLGNAKLKNLAPELQERFHYDPARAAVKELQQAGSNARYAQALKAAADKSPDAASGDKAVTPSEVPPHEITAKSFLNQPSPSVTAQKWLTPTPDLAGKFILLDFWATWSGPSRGAIPELNAFSSKFKDRLVVVGLSDETEEDVRKMTDPKIEYPNAIDPAHHASAAFGVERIPHAVLVDPKGIVRFEGHPGYLDEAKLTTLLDRYSP